MLLTADHARMMARCTAWQNAQVMRGVDGVGLPLWQALMEGGALGTCASAVPT